ncbi:plasmid-related protein [Pseudomonas sp. Pseu.R1]|uniref:plasmid-related protein n=1 Tax=Pseudomonas sp. Pseu.R1 TaxID=3379818 RepID=UPI003B94C177
MTTEQYLLERFGPLMSIVDLAAILGRSPGGVRVALYSNTEISKRLKPTMLKIGRRVYFRTLQVKEVLSLDGERGSAIP